MPGFHFFGTILVKPQFGQEIAVSENSLAHSGHVIRAKFLPP